MHSTTALAALAILACAAAIDIVTTEDRVAVLASGMRVPYSALEPFQAEITEHFVRHHVYEVTPHNRLVGFHLDEDLTSLPVLRRISDHHHPHVLIDGVPVRLSADASIRTASRFAALVDHSDNQVLLVWGDGLNLVPIGGRYRNVLVNTVRHRTHPHLTELEDVIQLNRSSSSHSASVNTIPATPDAAMASDQLLPSQNDASRMDRSTSRSCLPNSPKKFIELALAFGSYFCDRYDGNPVKAVLVLRSVAVAASVPYEKQTCLELTVANIEGYCDKTKDPFLKIDKLSDLRFIAEEFQKFWFANRKNVHRDIAYFFHGYDPDADVLGLAQITGACDPQRAYGAIAFPAPLVLTHEIGHNLGCRHTSYGIMRSYYGSGVKPKFQGTSLWQMFKFVNNQRFMSACLERKGPPIPVPNVVAGKCNTGFSDKKVLLCRTFKLGNIQGPRGVAKVSVKVAYNVAEVQTSVVQPLIRIYLIKCFVSLRSDLTIAQVGKVYTFSEGARIVRQKWTMTDLFIPKNSNSCCGIKYYVYVWTFMCSTNSCRVDYLIKPFVLPCKNLCGATPGKTVLPMTESRECPTCQSQT